MNPPIALIYFMRGPSSLARLPAVCRCFFSGPGGLAISIGLVEPRRFQRALLASDALCVCFCRVSGCTTCGLHADAPIFRWLRRSPWAGRNGARPSGNRAWTVTLREPLPGGER